MACDSSLGYFRLHWIGRDRLQRPSESFDPAGSPPSPPSWCLWAGAIESQSALKHAASPGRVCKFRHVCPSGPDLTLASILPIMGLHARYPAYGGRGPSDLRLGLGLGAVATIFMALRVYVRLRVNKFGTTALIWSLVAWVWASRSGMF